MSRPAVSIVLSTYNGGAWAEEALGSALAQTFEDLEVVVVDDASHDDTPGRMRRMADADARVRFHVNERNLGEYGTWNRCLALARAPLVKFLCQDDRLHPDCVAAMAAVFAEAPSVGYVFARRTIIGAEAAAEQAWARASAEQHELLAPLERVNDGRTVYSRALGRGFRGNPFGEPTSAMVRRACFERLGGFSTRPKQMGDFEVWLRLCRFYDVGFVDRELSDYRVQSAEGTSVTAVTKRTGRDWLDELWILEGLLEYPEVRARDWRLHALRAWETLIAARRAGRRARSLGWRLRAQERGAALEYLRFRRDALARRAPPLHAPVVPLAAEPVEPTAVGGDP
jgi:glycosyltransferase involved in cell wall biosynthesis